MLFSSYINILGDFAPFEPSQDQIKGEPIHLTECIVSINKTSWFDTSQVGDYVYVSDVNGILFGERARDFWPDSCGVIGIIYSIENNKINMLLNKNALVTLKKLYPKSNYV